MCTYVQVLHTHSSIGPKHACTLTVLWGSSIALTNAAASTVQERTVSVRPATKRRVMDASYVRENLPASCEVHAQTVKHIPPPGQHQSITCVLGVAVHT